MRSFLGICGCVVVTVVGVQNFAPLHAQPDTLWTKTYGGGSDDCGYSVQECAGGGFIIAGGTWSFGAGEDDVYLIRTDANGDTLWTKTYGGTNCDWGWSVYECAGGGFIIAGETKSFGAGDADVYLVRTDANGNPLWTKTYGGANYDAAYSVGKCAGGGFIITGETRSFGAGGREVWLLRTDANGDTLWTKTYGGADDDVGCSVIECAGGGFIIAGCTWSFGAGSADVWLIRTDANGNTLWTKTYGGANFDVGMSVHQCADSGFIMAGYYTPSSSEDVYLIRTKANGDTLWTKTYGGASRDLGYSVLECADGGFIIAGLTWSFGAGRWDVYLIRLKDGPSGADETSDSQLPISDCQLSIYPNPFTTRVRIQWSEISERERIGLKIYDLSGKLVKTIGVSAGSREIAVNLEELPNGIYFVKMEAGKFTATRKLTIIK
ncbi:MAG: T9SS type A sorting domain-containing protein [bacterium]|nr:T9SS type A sorting domain-containing protein [bacterium]